MVSIPTAIRAVGIFRESDEIDCDEIDCDENALGVLQLSRKI